MQVALQHGWANTTHAPHHHFQYWRQYDKVVMPMMIKKKDQKKVNLVNKLVLFFPKAVLIPGKNVFLR